MLCSCNSVTLQKILFLFQIYIFLMLKENFDISENRKININNYICLFTDRQHQICMIKSHTTKWAELHISKQFYQHQFVYPNCILKTFAYIMKSDVMFWMFCETSVQIEGAYSRQIQYCEFDLKVEKNLSTKIFLFHFFGGNICQLVTSNCCRATVHLLIW